MDLDLDVPALDLRGELNFVEEAWNAEPIARTVERYEAIIVPQRFART